MKPFETFTIEQLEKDRGDKAWHEFLRTPALYSGLYVLKAGAEDSQQPHRNDEVYYVLKGDAKIEMGSEKQLKTVSSGSVIYIKAEEHHRFVDITEDLHLLVFFSTANP